MVLKSAIRSRIMQGLHVLRAGQHIGPPDQQSFSLWRPLPGQLQYVSSQVVVSVGIEAGCRLKQQLVGWRSHGTARANTLEESMGGGGWA
jgi:hypothetical protein